MNLYLRDKEKYQEGMLAERALTQKQTIDTARSLIGLLTPEVIITRFKIPAKELLEQHNPTTTRQRVLTPFLRGYSALCSSCGPFIFFFQTPWTICISLAPMSIRAWFTSLFFAY